MTKKTDEQTSCPCEEFVPEEFRIDIIAPQPGGRFKVVDRYHKECEIHGIKIRNNPRAR